MNVLQQLDAIFTVQAGLLFAVVMICLLCVYSMYVEHKAKVHSDMLKEAYDMNDQWDDENWHRYEADAHYAAEDAKVDVPYISYHDWLLEVKALGGYYTQPDEGDSFYGECWSVGYTPQQVTDYLNQPFN